MWQRKQTIFLALTAFCLVAMIFFPIWKATVGNDEMMLFPLHYTVKTGDVRNTIYFPYALSALLAVAAATIALIEIGKFENRLLQVKMGALNSLLMAGCIGSSVYFATNIIKTNQVAGSYGWALWLPAIAMVSNMVANRFIRRDEKLVRDADRLR
ncbi:MAG: DUF4293 domain-containing protein [Bacteroidetes bacterium]|nr:DUF4293 domain-containing protein [Bacteroidota bacterium]MBS1975772.1 DUF4293 domain-containing protein [Bacteroidota bacterium]